MDTKSIIKSRRKALGLTEQQLADRIGVSRGSVQMWERGDTAPKRGNQQAAADALGVTVAELMGLQTTAQVVRVSGPAADRVEAMASMGAVPLISWVQAGCWSDVADPFQPGDADEWLPCPVAHGPRCYAVRVRGDSMNNPGARPSYSDGDIIFVDPDRRANHGDRVIVRLDDHAEATFKQLLIEDGRKLLKALNPEWSPRYISINGHATIVGVVIGKWVPE
jgi:SOS-response transcriptional repressor LexA